jgi:hypothetical protein
MGLPGDVEKAKAERLQHHHEEQPRKHADQSGCSQGREKKRDRPAKGVDRVKNGLN